MSDLTIPIRHRAAAPVPGAAVKPKRPVTRKDFTDRLGLPSDASNAEILAAVDAAAARKSMSAEDALYAKVFGSTGATADAEPDEDADADDDDLYRKVMG